MQNMPSELNSMIDHTQPAPENTSEEGRQSKDANEEGGQS